MPKEVDLSQGRSWVLDRGMQTSENSVQATCVEFSVHALG